MSAGTLISKAGLIGALVVERIIESHDRRTRELAWLMSHDGPNEGRGTVVRAPSSVNATTVRATQARRVRDSHDARDAASRATVRPYSAAQLALDVKYQYPNARRSGDVETLTVPTWYLALLDGASLTSDGRTAALAPFTRRTFERPGDERKERKGRKPRTVNVKEERAAKMRRTAGTIRMGEQD